MLARGGVDQHPRFLGWTSVVMAVVMLLLLAMMGFMFPINNGRWEFWTCSEDCYIILIKF